MVVSSSNSVAPWNEICHGRLQRVFHRSQFGFQRWWERAGHAVRCLAVCQWLWFWLVFLLLEKICARKNTMREQRRRTNIIWESWLDKEQKHRWKLSVTSTSGNTIQSLPLLLPSHWQSQFTLITTAFFLLVRAHHVKIHDLPSICLLGRYNKFSRNLPQTPWIVDGERKLVTSLEELIVGQVSKLIKFQG